MIDTQYLPIGKVAKMLGLSVQTIRRADGNLQRQRERLERYAEERGYDVIRVFSEQASGIHENRKQLAALHKLAEDREIDRVLIEYPDRLARFGYRYLKH